MLTRYTLQFGFRGRRRRPSLEHEHVIAFVIGIRYWIKNDMTRHASIFVLWLTCLTGGLFATDRPNILFIMSDDHACNAISAYGGRLADVAPTPNIDRIARQGMRLDKCFVTNSICTPSRAVILSGQHSHINTVRTLMDCVSGDLMRGRRTSLTCCDDPAMRPRCSENGIFDPSLGGSIIGKSVPDRANITIPFSSHRPTTFPIRLVEVPR